MDRCGLLSKYRPELSLATEIGRSDFDGANRFRGCSAGFGAYSWV